MEQTERELRNAREVRHVPESVMTASSTREQTNQVGTRNSDHEPNTAVVEIRLTQDEEVIHAHNQGVQVPLPDGGISSHSTHMEESIERTVMPNIATIGWTCFCMHTKKTTIAYNQKNYHTW